MRRSSAVPASPWFEPTSATGRVPVMGREIAFFDRPLARRAMYQKFAGRGPGKLRERLTPHRGRRFARQ